MGPENQWGFKEMRKQFRSSAIVSLIAIVAMALGLGLSSSASASASSVSTPLTASQAVSMTTSSQTVTVCNTSSAISLTMRDDDAYGTIGTEHTVKPGECYTMKGADRAYKHYFTAYDYAFPGYYVVTDRSRGVTYTVKGNWYVDLIAFHQYNIRYVKR